MTAFVELLAPFALPAAAISFASYAALASALTAINFGLLAHYRTRSEHTRLVLLILYLGCLVWHPIVLLHVERDGVLHAFGYQAPFAAMSVAGCLTVWRYRRNRFDLILAVVLALMAAQFLAKAGLAVSISTGAGVSSYALSLYASISQAAGAILSVGLGISLLGVILFDAVLRHSDASRHDHLSGLLNRYGFLQWLEKGRKSLKLSPAYLAVCDLDHFKTVNDTYGHAMGDEVIRRAAACLGSAVRNGAVARFGGEEFVILLSGVTEEGAVKAIDELRVHLSQVAISFGSATVSVTMSAGLAAWSADERLDDVICRADAALYQAKSNGRNRVEVFREPSQQLTAPRRSLADQDQ